jgi:D-beta-D-heptose 7-phosphate kinase/D-beta-D-heptose 1-phosphate adenosyltransferase
MKRVFTNGCFDVLHKGHFKLLEYCKSLGYVIVGLSGDISVKKLKGFCRPVNAENDRKYMLESCKFVDRVVVFNEKTPYALIKHLKPDIIVKGGDYKKEDVVGNDVAEVKIFDYIDGYSTTSMIKRGKNDIRF